MWGTSSVDNKLASDLGNRTCAETVLKGRCPNCGGELVRRPIRPAEKLAKYPASTTRKVKPAGCVAA